MALDEQMQRQAVVHGVADAIAGVTRAHIVDDVYDRQYWADYDAGHQAWKEAEQRDEMPAGRERPVPPEVGTGRSHDDAQLAERGWAEWHGGYARNRPGSGPAWTTRGSWARELDAGQAPERHPRGWAVEAPEAG
jgi:hypothetical protein